MNITLTVNRADGTVASQQKFTDPEKALKAFGELWLHAIARGQTGEAISLHAELDKVR